MKKRLKVIIFTYYKNAEPLLCSVQKFASISLLVLPANRSKETLSPVISWAKRNGVEYLVTKDVNAPDLLKKIKEITPDLNIAFNFPQIFTGDLLTLARTINFHPGDLPNYRGAHVLNWAIINGEKKIAITCHLMDKGIDTGNIIGKKYINILSADAIEDLTDRVGKTTAKLFETCFNKIADPFFLGEKQNDQEAVYYHRRRPEDGLINWNLKTKSIVNLVRALSYPWPGAYTIIEGKKLIIDKIKIRKQPALKVGEYKKLGKKLFFGGIDDVLEVISWRIE